MLLPQRGVLTDAEGTVLWSWENNTPDVHFDLLPPLIQHPETGEMHSIAPPDAIVVNVDESLMAEELPMVYGDMADKSLRVRRVDGHWKFFKVIRELLVPPEEARQLQAAGEPVPQLEVEVPHPIEAIRQARRELKARREAGET
jgi:hypothetical protein